MKKIKSFIALTAIITLCINGNLTSSAYYINYSQGHSPIPDSIEYYYDFSTETVQALKNACSEWNSADSNRNFLYVGKFHTNTTAFYNNKANQITSGKRGTNTYLMEHRMVRGISGNVSYEGDIDINVSHPFGTASTSYDTETALLHEFGHFLGLGHSGTTYSVMSTPQAKGQRKRSLFEDDINGINAIYNK